MIRTVLRSGDPALRKKSKPVVQIDKKISNLITDLKDTLVNHKDPEGVGLAAPQIGKNLRLFVILDNKKITTIINPKIIKIEKNTSKKKKTKLLEGCLSVPHFYGPLTKPDSVTLTYMNENGQILTHKFEGFKAQIILHEIDHLNGVLFIDDIIANDQPLYEQNKSGEWKEVEL